MDGDFGDIFRIIIIAAVFGIWIIGQFIRIFVRNPQRGGKNSPRPNVAPAPRPAAGGKRPERRLGENMGREFEDFLRQLQGEEEKAQRPAPLVKVEEVEEEVAPEPWEVEARRFEPPTVKKTPSPPVVLLAPPPLAETSSALPSTVYSAPTSFDLPNWLSISDIVTPRERVDTIFGVDTKDAIILKEIIGPPKALQFRRRAFGPR